MSACGGSPRNGLAVDVTKVFHREPVRGEQCRKLVQVRASTKGDLLELCIDVKHAIKTGEIHLDSRGSCDRRKAVTGAYRFDGKIQLARTMNDRDNLVDRRWAGDEGRIRGFDAPPVTPVAPWQQQVFCANAPLRSRVRHSHNFPSPRYVGIVFTI